MSRIGQEPIAIDYMPWADLNEEFSIGPVAFWPFYDKVEEKIPDAEVRADLVRFFETFVDNLDRPVRSVVACSCGEIGFRRFTPEEVVSIRSAVDCLVFAVIATGTKNGVCADNTSMAPPSADRFDLCARWVWPSHDGLVVQTENSISLWTRGKYRIAKPLSTGGTFTGRYAPVLEGLSRTFDSSFPTDLRQRLFRSLEWFRFAHTESTAVSPLQKVVMLATAFEILLEFPEFGKKSHFIREIDSRLRLDESYLVTRQDGKGNEFQVGLAAEWAATFYELRSRIVHGDPIKLGELVYRSWFTHAIVADLVLLELVTRILFAHRCVGEDLRRTAARFAECCTEPVEAIQKTFLPGSLGFNFEDVHEALAWIPPAEERRRKLEERLKDELPPEA